MGLKIKRVKSQDSIRSTFKFAAYHLVFIPIYRDSWFCVSIYWNNPKSVFTKKGQPTNVECPPFIIFCTI